MYLGAVPGMLFRAPDVGPLKMVCDTRGDADFAAAIAAAAAARAVGALAPISATSSRMEEPKGGGERAPLKSREE